MKDRHGMTSHSVANDTRLRRGKHMTSCTIMSEMTSGYFGENLVENRHDDPADLAPPPAPTAAVVVPLSSLESAKNPPNIDESTRQNLPPNSTVEGNQNSELLLKGEKSDEVRQNNKEGNDSENEHEMALLPSYEEIVGSDLNSQHM